LEILRSLDRTREVPILMLTGKGDRVLKRQALELGATDFLNKPVDREELVARIMNSLRIKTYLDAMKGHNHTLEKAVQERTRELEKTRLQIIHRLGRAAEYRDNETGMHVIRMSQYARLLGLQSGLTPRAANLLLEASPMHDIGKIGIPDKILLKPGKLDPDEWELMKTHVPIGAEILSGDDSDLLRLARIVVLEHHEKWNGRGYPHGLKGDQITLEGRIVALCDVFDALTSERPYKKAWSVDVAVRFIEERQGKDFDPRLVQNFIQILPDILEIKDRYPDHGNGPAVKLISAHGETEKWNPSGALAPQLGPGARRS
ncbi:MAG: HD domain-containing protein, partial [Nitrospinaceae bacterium]|nr:HD domain-containing protein [Nitrospinaceae bacterium]NIR55661.1 HD domain-containing protein [Nitrospinaceae bacterium]NIS86105.1 HD domain-containing protein [Nitrospinaceae bacterium]NIT82949.1 HD domain-containing protein [Nitrospinaceae bacterium]NIU45152.1 HD domain-containing protein [Nitrospinaceae bacterium]